MFGVKYYVIDIWVHCIIQVQKFGGCPIRNFGTKICKIWDEITQIMILIANIERKKLVHFGPLTKKVEGESVDPPK